MAESPLLTAAFIFSRVVDLYSLLLLAWIITSWLRVNPLNPIVNALRQICEPPLTLIKRALPFLVMGGLDLSPIVLLFGLQILSRGLIRFAVSLS